MNVLIKSATILDPQSDFHNKTQDILVENGVIVAISDLIENSSNFKELKLDNLHVSQGWFDSSVCFGEPGYEERETIENGLRTAAYSGFTAVAVNSNSQPVVDSGSEVAFLRSKAKDQSVTVLPIGALTKDYNQKDLAELFDMHQAGAVAFNDYKTSTGNANLIKLALQYASNFNGLVCSFPLNASISGNGVMNEHITSTKLGLKGIPNLSEELQIVRDLFILEYTGGKLHIPTISTAKSVELIRDAKQKGLDISCSVAIHNLFYTDEAVNEFDTHFKVLPPLRTQDDIDALIAGLKDGTIDMVTSDHNPLNIELKKVEFDHASFGTVGLESAFGALQTLFNTEQAIELLTRGKSRFGLDGHSIGIGNTLNVTFFNPKPTYVFYAKDLVSKSKNTIFEKETLQGFAYGVFANNKLILNPHRND